MITSILWLLILFWIFAYTPLSASFNGTIFTLGGISITLWDIFILLVVGWLIGLLPAPFREIASLILFLWVLSVFGILTFIPALPSILTLTIIIGLIAYLFGGRYYHWH